MPSHWLKAQKSLSGHHLQLAVALGTLSGWLLMPQAWCLAKVLSGTILERQPPADLMPWMLALPGIFLLRAFLIWASEQSAFIAAGRIKLNLREALYAKLRRLGPTYLAEQRSGDLTNTLVDGIEALESYYARFLPAISQAAVLPLSILACAFPVDGMSALVMLGTAPLIPLFMILIGHGAQRRNQRQWRRLAQLSAHFLDTLQGLTTLKLFNASRREAELIARISDDYRKTTLSVLRIAFLSSFALEFFSTLSIAIVAVLIGFRLYAGELDLFYGLFLLLLAPEFYLPLRGLGTHYHARMQAIAAAAPMIELLQQPLPVPDARHEPRFLHGKIGLRLSGVGFQYRDGRRALERVDLDIAPGERIAIVGPSGAGKSTLLNLLLGFQAPDRGRILVNGQPLSTLTLADWRSRIAWLPQRPRLFPGSLAENIRLARPDADRRAVIRAARMAQADSFIEALPEGYDTPVGEGGAGLSGGQIQRIALARAFLKNAPLVILDEATANLDPGNEARIRQVLAKLTEKRTLIMVAHRLQTLTGLQRIVVLDRGRIVEDGSHDELLAREGLYHRLAGAYGGWPM